MSVTFSAPGAPQQVNDCPFCKQAVDGGYDENGHCDRFCNGVILESEAPEVNLANGNARNILDLMGYDPSDLWGHLEPEEVASFRQRIVMACNQDRSHLEVEPSSIPGGWAGTKVVTDENGMPRIQRMGPAIINMGNTDERTLERLEALTRLAIYAQEHNLGLAWG